MSFVGIGKDYKQHNTSTTSQNSSTAASSNNINANTTINSLTTTPTITENNITRRSPNKKQTPSSNSNTNPNPNPASNLLTPTAPIATTMLSPNKPNTQSHSLTRLHKTYPHRFKSLSSHSSNTIDNSSPSRSNEQQLLKAANSKEAINATSLSPAPSRKNVSILQASSANFINTSTSFKNI